MSWVKDLLERHMKVVTRAIKNPAKDPFSDPDSFGNIALEMRYITKEDLLNALKKQEQRLPLGEILVSMGKLAPWQKEEILFEQAARKAATSEEKVQVEISRQRNILRGMTSCMVDMQEVTSNFVSTVTNCTPREVKK